MARAEVTATGKRRRRSPEEVHAEAVKAARKLLASDGPGAITLQAVAGAIGMTHGNLLHHVGSAASLQSMLVSAMVRDLVDRVLPMVERLRRQEIEPAVLVDLVFDVCEQGGMGKLVAWMLLNGQSARLLPVFAVIRETMIAIESSAPVEIPAPLRRERIEHGTLALLLPAIGASVLAPILPELIGDDHAAVRRISMQLLDAMALD